MISETREESIALEAEDQSDFRIYSDRSGQEGGVGTAAVMYKKGESKPIRTLKYHLGKDNEHTTYEVEAVGATLAVRLVKEVIDRGGEAESGQITISHYVNNQALVKAIRTCKARPGQVIVNTYRKRMLELMEGDRVKVEVRWISAHSGVEGNEVVDEAAKEAAGGEMSEEWELLALLRGGLRKSKSSVKREMKEQLKKREKEEWKESPRYERMKRIDPKYPYKRFRRWREKLDRNQGSILDQLRSGYLLVNSYLKKIGKKEEDHCDWCKEEEGREIPETIHHFVLDCNAHAYERFDLKRKLGLEDIGEIKDIFATEKGTRELLNFLDATRRFRETMGRVRIRENQRQEERQAP